MLIPEDTELPPDYVQKMVGAYCLVQHLPNWERCCPTITPHRTPSLLPCLSRMMDFPLLWAYIKVCPRIPTYLAASCKNSYLFGSISSDCMIKGICAVNGPLFGGHNVDLPVALCFPSDILFMKTPVKMLKNLPKFYHILKWIIVPWKWQTYECSQANITFKTIPGCERLC